MPMSSTSNGNSSSSKSKNVLLFYLSKKNKKQMKSKVECEWVRSWVKTHQVHMQLTNKKTCFLFFDVEVSL